MTLALALGCQTVALGHGLIRRRTRNGREQRLGIDRLRLFAPTLGLRRGLLRRGVFVRAVSARAHVGLHGVMRRRARRLLLRLRLGRLLDLDQQERRLGHARLDVDAQHRHQHSPAGYGCNRDSGGDPLWQAVCRIVILHADQCFCLVATTILYLFSRVMSTISISASTVTFSSQRNEMKGFSSSGSSAYLA